MISITDIYKLIPDSLKQSAVDAIVETVVERGEGLLSESILNKIKGLRSDAAFRRQFDAGCNAACSGLWTNTSLQAARETQPEQDHLARLRQILLDLFNEDELRTLCFDMALDYEMLPGQGKGGKARELVAYLERRNRLAELLENLHRLRPNTRDTDPLVTEASQLSNAEQFDAIIWTSAKSTVHMPESDAVF